METIEVRNSMAGSQGVFWKPDMWQGAAREVREEVTRSKEPMETLHGGTKRQQGRQRTLTWRRKFKMQKEETRNSPSFFTFSPLLNLSFLLCKMAS